MTRFVATAVASAFAISMTAPATVQAAPSQDECAIWLCLPFGFPSGCSDAKKAMRDRLLNFQSPIPRWGSCSVGDAPGPDLVWNSFAIYDDPEMGPVMVSDMDCEPDKDEGYTPNQHCFGTVTQIEVWMDGELVGEPYVTSGWDDETVDMFYDLPLVEKDELSPLEDSSAKPSDENQAPSHGPEYVPDDHMGGNR